MKLPFRKISSVFAVGAALAIANAAQAVSFSYSSEPSSAINFDGSSHFSFTGNAGDIFQVTSGTANGLLGDLTGTFSIGAVNVVSTVPYFATAPVTGTGQFIIHDGANNFTANISWVDIAQTGAGGGLNIMTASVNMGGITYGGSNADLLALKNSGVAVNTVSFQFTTQYTLNDLKNTKLSNSFSGTVASVPDSGTSVALLGLALSGLAFIRRKMLA